MVKIPSRWKSYVLWVAIAALFGDVLLDFGVMKDIAKYNVYVDKVFYILILLGIINNPTNKKGL